MDERTYSPSTPDGSDLLLMPRRNLIAATFGLGLCAALPGQAHGRERAAASIVGGRPTSVPLEFVYDAIVTLGPVEEVGPTPLGKRVRIPITGGTFVGPRLSGTILPEGMDWQLIRADGFTTIEASYLMRERDGTLIHIYNKGVAGKEYVRTSPIFEVALGPHQWLNQSIFTGTISSVDNQQGSAVKISVYRLI